MLHHVEYLLQSHDCVIIPGLGAILGHGSAACYDEKSQLWHAPKRVLSFNPELSRTDGLLASSVARRDGVSIDAANAYIKTAVEQMRRQFELDSVLELGKIGKLHLTEYGSMAFETADTAWLSPDTLWLPQFELAKAETAAQLVRSYDKAERRNDRLRIALRRSGQIAASVAIVLILGFMAKLGLTDVQQKQFASLAPVTVENNSIETIETIVEPIEIAEPVAVIPEAIDEVEESANEQESAIRFNDSDKYYLIVASLATKEEADCYIRKHSDIKLGILASDGRFRAYAATGRTYAEASGAAENKEIQSRYASSWVCRR